MGWYRFSTDFANHGLGLSTHRWLLPSAIVSLQYSLLSAFQRLTNGADERASGHLRCHTIFTDFFPSALSLAAA